MGKYADEKELIDNVCNGSWFSKIDCSPTTGQHSVLLSKPLIYGKNHAAVVAMSGNTQERPTATNIMYQMV